MSGAMRDHLARQITAGLDGLRVGNATSGVAAGSHRARRHAVSRSRRLLLWGHGGSSTFPETLRSDPEGCSLPGAKLCVKGT